MHKAVAALTGGALRSASAVPGWSGLASCRPVLVAGLVFALLFAACAGDGGTETTRVAPVTPGSATSTPATTTMSLTTTISLPPVVEPAPSPLIVAFYYPWYGNGEFGGGWEHWGDMGNDPEIDVPSDFYPLLGTYSSYDPAAAAQHLAWLREAGVGAVAVSWWGPGTYEDQAVPILLDVAEHYGVQLAFHIEPYRGRSVNTLASDIGYIYEHYGNHPAFYRTTATSRWSPGDAAKGLFFVWNAGHPDNETDAVAPEYWLPALDLIHDRGDGAIVLADRPDGSWVDGGHFDGVYNYATLEENPSFLWSRTLPPGGWYVPCVLPGFSAARVGYEASTFVPRHDGATYRRQWAAALSTGIQPALVAITSFNEWHEGTQIEPAEAGRTRGGAGPYDDYGALGPMGYLQLTAEQVASFLASDFPQQPALRIRIHMTTTSDWSTLALVSEGAFARPEVTSISESGWYQWETTSRTRLALFQALGDAEAGHEVELVIETDLIEPAGPLTFRIERGGLGGTGVAVSVLTEDGLSPPVEVGWAGHNDDLADGEPGRNPYLFTVPLG